MFTNEYSFTGRHAQMVKELVTDGKIGLFNRNLDVYIVAPIIGFLYDRQALPDKSEPTTKIFTQQLLNEESKIKFIYRLIMLLYKSDEIEAEVRMEKAFQGDMDEEAFKKNKEIFNGFLLGGVEYLHETTSSDGIDQHDYLESLYHFVEEFNEDLIQRDEMEEESVHDIIRRFE